MTKKLEDLLNLPDSKDIIETAKTQESDQKSYEIEESFRDIEEFDKIASALPAVKGLGKMADEEPEEDQLEHLVHHTVFTHSSRNFRH